MTDTEKSPEELRAELAAKRAELGDTVEELAHRVDVPAQVKAKKDDTVAKLHDAKVEATRRVQGTEKVKAAIAEKAPVVQQKVDQAVGKSKAVYAEKAPPAVQQKVDQAVEKGKAVYAEKAPVVQQHVHKAVADAKPVVQEKVAQGQALLAEKAPPVERTLREKPGLIAGIAVALVVLLIATSRKKKTT
jgi:altronate dehydratase